MITKKQFRNFLHILICAIIAWVMFQTFKGVNILMQHLFVSFVTVVIGVFWEVFWHKYTGSKVDYKDVIRGVISANLIVLILNIL